MTSRLIPFGLLITSLIPATAVAQPLRPGSGLQERRAPAELPTQALDAVRVQRQVKPAFIINPLVHRLTARRGQLLTYEFEIESNARPTRLEISPVAMLQQEHGVIMPDPDAVPPGAVEMLTPANVSLQVGESHRIRCRLRVPPLNAPFLSFGVLVKELPPEPDRNNKGADSPQVGIRFLTQYLLRADVRVLGVPGDTVRSLEIDAGRLVSRDGNAVIQAYVNNPTDTSMEFQMKATLVSAETGRRYPTKLWMPVRASQPEPDRYRVRILGQTRLRLEGGLPEPVFPGDYDLELELVYQNRVYRKASFRMTIQSGDFPAQDATIVRVTRDIALEPPHVELSLRKGGSRLQSFTIVNGSQQKIVAAIRPRAFQGELSNWLAFKPEVVELQPGRKRKVLVMLGNKRDFTEHSYALAEVTVRPEIGEAIGTQQIPIALLANSDSTEVVQSAPNLEWKINAAEAGFELPIRNTGRRHLELQGRLSLRDQFGRGFVVEDGYGRWVLPGQQDRLWFRFPQLPPPGTYEVRAEISQGEQQAPLELQQTIQLKSPLEERVSRRETQLEAQ